MTSRSDPSRGLLDTSVVIDWDDVEVARALPDEVAISAITVAELAAGPHVTTNAAEAARRQLHLQRVESQFEPLPFDAEAARSYGLVVAAVVAAGRSQGSRIADLLIAATAHAHGLPLYTRNPDDFASLHGVIQIVAV
ncbi:MAG TPA: type II toxin-antitoxin system VapC family toxin [Jatrophihabitantaceae bacterium]|nr:type II toxin-antitoxin system VapC family toxin [Jatrophihabitantaceae bacterium]